MAVIVDHGMREMLVEQRDVFYYVTLMNENYAQPDLPAGARSDVIRAAIASPRYGDEGQPEASRCSARARSSPRW
jgi:pyruvate dehydrogenase E1 component